jgi:hypothetical protein
MTGPAAQTGLDKISRRTAAGGSGPPRRATFDSFLTKSADGFVSRVPRFLVRSSGAGSGRPLSRTEWSPGRQLP